MMNKNVIIIRNSGTVLSDAIENALKNECNVVMVDSPEPSFLKDIKPIAITAPYKFGEKEFKCKGKHQYREVKETQDDGFIAVSWVCQCGRNINL